MSMQKIEMDDLVKSITNVEYLSPKSNPCMTICVLTVTNPFRDIALDEDSNPMTIVGESACLKKSTYNKDIGEKVAYQNALNKLWSLFGFYAHMSSE